MVAKRVTDIEAELDSLDTMAVSVVSEELSAIAGELHGLHLQLDGSQATVSRPTRTAPSNLPVSRVKIPPDLHSPVMADRAAGKLGGSHVNPRLACILLATRVWYCCMQAVYYHGANHVSRGNLLAHTVCLYCCQIPALHVGLLGTIEILSLRHGSHKQMLSLCLASHPSRSQCIIESARTGMLMQRCLFLSLTFS